MFSRIAAKNISKSLLALSLFATAANAQDSQWDKTHPNQRPPDPPPIHRQINPAQNGPPPASPSPHDQTLGQRQSDGPQPQWRQPPREYGLAPVPPVYAPLPYLNNLNSAVLNTPLPVLTDPCLAYQATYDDAGTFLGYVIVNIC